MKKLSRKLIITIVSEHGNRFLLERLSDPFGSRHLAACSVLIGIQAAYNDSMRRYEGRIKALNMN